MRAILDHIVFRVAVVYGLGVLAAMSVGGAVPQLEAIARELHPDSPSVIGLVMSLPSLMVAVGAVLTGYFVDRYGDKRVLMLGSAILVAGDIIVAVAPAMDLLLAGRALSGLGYVLMAVSAITLLIRITSESQRVMAIAIWSTFVPVSFLIPFLTAGLIERTGSWRYAFVSHAALVVVLAVLGALCLPKRNRHSLQASRTSGLGAVLRSPWPYLLGIAIGGDAFLHVGIVATLAPYLQSHYGADPMMVNTWNAGATVVNAIGCLLLGKLLQWGVSPVRLGIYATIVTGAPALLIYALPIGVPASIACTWVMMFASGILTGMWAFMPSVAPSPDSIGATSGVVTQLTLLGVLLSGPVCFAAQAGASSTPMLMVISLGIVACLARMPILARGTVPVWAKGDAAGAALAAGH